MHPNLSMDYYPAENIQLQEPTMPSESIPDQPILEGCCLTPSASPTKVDVVSYQASPSTPTPKHVSFELLLDDTSKTKARIPMRVQIFPHDTTDSIVTTVKNFYGIYEATASGVSFEDENGITLIARYENLRNDMTVYVRVIPNQYSEPYHQQGYYAPTPVDTFKRPSLGDPFQPAQSSQGEHGRSSSRPVSRASRKQSASPAGRGRRSASTAKMSRTGNKSRGSSTHGSFHDDLLSQYDSDTTESRKNKNDMIASSDISMDNILLDGRRKRPKFESSVCISITSIASSSYSNLPLLFSGTAAVRSAPGSPRNLKLLHLPPAPIHHGSWIAHAARLFHGPASSIPSELRTSRAAVCPPERSIFARTSTQPPAARPVGNTPIKLLPQHKQPLGRFWHPADPRSNHCELHLG